MPQPPRLQSDEVLYHLTTRGVDRRPIFVDDEDRRFFLRLLARVARVDGFVVHAYCLMTNHVHLLVETPRANLAHGMQRLPPTTRASTTHERDAADTCSSAATSTSSSRQRNT
jgi:REP-associated tyrosine transposase